MGKSAHVILQKFQGWQVPPGPSGARGRGVSFFHKWDMLYVECMPVSVRNKGFFGDPLLKMTKSRGW